VTKGRTTFRYNDFFLDNFPEREKFETKLLELANRYLERTQRDLIKGTHPKLRYWANVYGKGDEHRVHTHGNTIISGSYYPVLGDPQYPITFESPWEMCCAWDTMPLRKHIADIYPQAGHLLMWPGWLRHAVRKIEEVNKPRISVSFNISYNLVEIE
jgi:uncharacterized protein (TIGR02466 family)